MDYITGAGGFIGSHLVKRLGSTVRAIPHADIYKTKLQDVSRFYFLSTYGNMATHQDEKAIIQANVTDLIKILEQINFEDINSFVFVSTSSVKRRVQTFYSRTKKAAEEILLSYMEKYNAPICIVRPLSVTGKGEQEDHLIPTLIRSCLQGTSMPFVPEPAHDYVWVEDLCEAITILSKRRARGVFEVGTGTQWTNQQVRDLVEKETGRKANLNVVTHLRSYDSDTWVSNNFAVRQFGWKPKRQLPDIIKQMVNRHDK